MAAKPAPTPSPQDALKAFLAETIDGAMAPIHKSVARIDQLDGKVEEAIELARKKVDMPDEVKEQLSRLAKRLEDAEARADAAEARAAGLPRQGAANDDLQQRIAADPYIQRIRKDGPGGLPEKGAGAKLGSLLLSQDLRRATIDTDAIASPITYRQGLVDYKLDATSLLSLIPRVEIGDRVYEFHYEDRISGEGGIVTTANGAVTGGAGATITFAEVEGLQNGATGVIRRTDGSGALLGYEEFTVQSFNPGTKVVTMTANIAGNVASGDYIQFTPYTTTAESGQKPYAFIKSSAQQVTLQTLAILAIVTRQSLKYNSTLENTVRTKLPRSHSRGLSRKLIYDTLGTGQLDGYTTRSTRQTYAWSEGAIGDTMADCVMRSGLLIPDEGMGPLQLSIRKEDWFSLVSEKTADGIYIHGQIAPILVIDRPGLRTIGTMMAYLESMLKANGDFLVRNPECSELVIGADTAEFAWGYINNQFGSNEMTARYEEDYAHAVLSDQLYVHGNFDARPQAAP